MRSRWEDRFNEILPWVAGYSANKAMPHHHEVKVLECGR